MGTAVAWIERMLRALDRFQQGHTVLGFPVAVAKKFGDDQAGKHAALLAYYGFLSLFPLLLVFLTLLGYALANDQELQQAVIDTLARQFPVLGSQIEKSISTINGSGVALAVGVLGTLWGGLGHIQTEPKVIGLLLFGGLVMLVAVIGVYLAFGALYDPATPLATVPAAAETPGWWSRRPWRSCWLR